MLKLLKSFLTLSVIVGPLPNNIADGQVADAAPVMLNMNWIVNQVNANAVALSSGNNVSFGSNALSSITSGLYNIALGPNSLLSLTTGNSNIALGLQAAQTITTVSDVVAIGRQALVVNQVGSMTAVGAGALFNNTTGANNTALGWSAGTGLTGGFNNNTAVGYGAMQTTSSPSNATVVGYSAGQNVTSLGATAFGAQALQAQTSGVQATAVGYQAMATSTTSANCTAVGYQALSAYNNVSGNCVAVGASALAAATGGSNNTAVGTSAMSGVVTSGNANTCVGSAAGAAITTGVACTFVGNQAGNVGTAVISSQNLTLIGNSAQANANNWNNSVGLGANSIVTASNTIVLGDLNIGFIRCQVQTINVLSDARHKQDVAELSLGLDFISRLRPVEYRFDNGDKTLRWGFIAQEVETALPTREWQLAQKGLGEGGIEFLCRENNDEKTLLLGYAALFAPMVKAIKELKAENDNLKARLAKAGIE